jgi:hypothetical protein
MQKFLLNTAVAGSGCRDKALDKPTKNAAAGAVEAA